MENQKNYKDRNSPSSAEDDFFDLDFYFQELKKSKNIIGGTTLLFIFLGLVYSLSLPDIYESNAIIRPVEETVNSSSSQLNRLSGIAALVGIDVGKSPALAKLAYGQQILHSRSFTKYFVSNIEVAKYLSGYQSWNKNKKIDKFNSKIFDEKNNKFLKQPTDQDLYDLLQANIFFEVDDKTNFLTLSFRHESPMAAHSILSLLISDLNKVIRQQTIDDTNTALSYLELEANKTQFLDRKKVFFNLIEQQESLKMLAFVNNEYFFSVIDPPHIPLKKIAPARSILCILFALGGFFLSLITIVIRTFLKTLAD
jgi:LPS O-antigen subunit length determinant protein (WzzB/FepE family)